jgi:hypothetical protein
MKTRPQKWTSHHSQRVLHLPLLAMCMFLLATIVCIFLIFFFQVQADLSGSVSLSATVPAIQPGPDVILANNSASAPAPLPDNSSAQKNNAQSANLKTTPVGQAANTNNAPQVSVDLNDNSGTSSARIYSSQEPTFSGKTDIKNAIIFIEVHSVIIRGTTYADSDGKWAWTPSDPLEVGNHTLMITAQDPLAPEITAKVSYNFVIKLLPGQKPLPLKQYPALKKTDQNGVLFDVLVKINPSFKVVAPGDEVLATIKLINFGEAGSPVDVPV